MKKITYTSGTFRQKYSLGCAQFERNLLCCVLTKFSIYHDSLTGVTPQYKNWSRSLFAEYLSVISVKLGQFPQEIKTAIIKICMEINFYFDTEMALRSSDLLFQSLSLGWEVSYCGSLMCWNGGKMGKAGAPSGSAWPQLQGVLGWSIWAVSELRLSSDPTEEKWTLNFKAGVIFEQSVW